MSELDRLSELSVFEITDHYWIECMKGWIVVCMKIKKEISGTLKFTYDNLNTQSVCIYQILFLIPIDSLC